MSSFGAGGGSATQPGGGQDPRSIMKGLGMDQIFQQIGQQFQQGQSTNAVRPGQMATMSPQQRLAAVMAQYAAPAQGGA